MRQKKGVPAIRRWATIAVVAVLAAVIAAPFAALSSAEAATYCQPTLSTSPGYMVAPTNMSVKGWLGWRHANKYVAVEVRKPGRAYWDQVLVLKTDSGGYFSGAYKPKLGGKFFIRVRCLTHGLLSRTTILTVSRSIPRTTLLLASTTSTRDSGLFERLGPFFAKTCPEYTLKATFVGSGAAIALGGTGDADVLLTHSPKAEVDFMNGMVAGSPSAYRGLRRYKVMYNDYILVGPTSNPAGVVNGAAAGSPAAAFQKIATAGSTFWSRNDKSGTNEKEKAIWASIGNPQIGKPWYKATGTMGMAQALAAANDASTGGYTLADRATWLNATSLGITKNLKIVNAGAPTYFNQYSVIEVRSARNQEGAQDFSNWIRSPETQALIKSFGEYTYPGQIMFVPNAGSY
jgi:tungstate transport system substrate-binding protein